MKQEVVQRILREEDVEGFIARGAPHDEYEMEAREITSVITKHADWSEETLLAYVRNMWEQRFGPFAKEESAARAPDLLHVVRRIMKVWTTGSE
jgi:hypothetical protein